MQYLTGGRTARGRNVAVMSGSGGSLVNFADGADEFSLRLGPFTEATRAILSETLPSIATIDNPIDYTAGFNKESNAPRYLKVIEAVLADPGVDQLGLFLASAAGGSFVSAAITPFPFSCTSKGLISISANRSFKSQAISDTATRV